MIRVLAEGKVTEPEYFRSLKGSEVQLDFGDTNSFTPIALVRQARCNTSIYLSRHTCLLATEFRARID